MASPGWLQRPYGSRRRHPISTILDHAMVAELFYHTRLQGGVDSGLHGAHVGALVTGDAGVRRQQRRTREAVIAALRALADGAEQEVTCHTFLLATAERHRTPCDGGATSPHLVSGRPRCCAGGRAAYRPLASSRRAGLGSRRLNVG